MNTMCRVRLDTDEEADRSDQAGSPQSSKGAQRENFNIFSINTVFSFASIRNDCCLLSDHLPRELQVRGLPVHLQQHPAAGAGPAQGALRPELHQCRQVTSQIFQFTTLSKTVLF